MLPYKLSSKYEPRTRLTPVNVSRPTEPSPERRAGGNVDDHAGGCLQIGNSRITVTSDRVVAATALELVERAVDAESHRAAGVRAGAVEALRVGRGGTGIEDVCKICSGDKLDRPQRVGAGNDSLASVCVLRHRTVGELDVDSARSIRIIGAVITELTVEKVVAAAALEEIV